MRAEGQGLRWAIRDAGGAFVGTCGFNAINLIGMPTYWQFLTQGLLLIIGVAISTLARRRQA